MVDSWVDCNLICWICVDLCFWFVCCWLLIVCFVLLCLLILFG